MRRKDNESGEPSKKRVHFTSGGGEGGLEREFLQKKKNSQNVF